MTRWSVKRAPMADRLYYCWRDDEIVVGVDSEENAEEVLVALQDTEAQADQRARDYTVALEDDNAQLAVEYARALEALAALVKGIDDWNEQVQRLIGRRPEYRWGDLEGARELVLKSGFKRVQGPAKKSGPT